MAKKKFKIDLKVAYDAPVTLTFVIICVLLLLLNNFVIKNGALERLLASPTSQAGALPFVVQEPLSYLRLLLYIFGSGATVEYITNLLIILMLGPAMEERYGSVIIGIMIFVSALFSGVLNASFCNESLVGAVPVVCMMTFLTAFVSFSNKTVPMTFLATIVAFGYLAINSGLGAVRFIICVAGGLCGSLLAFLTSPKMKAEKKASKSGGAGVAGKTGKGGGLLNRAEKVAYAEELDRNSPRNKKSEDDDDTTVVGTLKF